MPEMFEIRRVCPQCGKRSIFSVELEKYERWAAKKENIQDVFPELTPIERECIMTGFCSDKCWNALWGDEK